MGVYERMGNNVMRSGHPVYKARESSRHPYLFAEPGNRFWMSGANLDRNFGWLYSYYPSESYTLSPRSFPHRVGRQWHEFDDRQVKWQPALLLCATVLPL